MKMQFLALLFCFTSLSAHAQSLDAPVSQFLNEISSQKIPLPGHPELSNHYYKTKNKSSQAIVYIPGMGEAALKYYNIVEDLKSTGATIYIWDHIGQGFSSYQIQNDTGKIYIDSFNTHIAALEQFLGEVKKNHSQVTVIAHSMGAHLTLRTLLKHPDYVQKLVLSSPLIALNDTKVPWPMIEWFLGWFDPQGHLPFYAFFKGKAADMGYVSNDQEKLERYKRTVAHFPELKKTDLTPGWLLAAIQSLDEMHKEDYTKLKTPVLLLQAEKDFLVNNSAQTKFCKRMDSCVLIILPGSLHEIFFETKEIYGKALEETKKFISSKAP